jgi:hypothetical protein
VSARAQAPARAPAKPSSVPMPTRIQLVTILGAVVLLVTVLEMVRRRRLIERYALLWLLSAVVLLGLAIWSDALARISRAIGVIYPPNALFFVTIGCIVLLLLHFSSVLSRLSDQSETLAQRQALLEERLRRQELRTRPAERPGSGVHASALNVERLAQHLEQGAPVLAAQTDGDEHDQ